ncbi:MAG: TIGR01777 family oxidoreductase [Candidatus Eremiobacteraeota bacterium]|nr:TIGR01777 family oxidoreductase [Candidatus Eremiobacteraeota bacterium]
MLSRGDDVVALGRRPEAMDFPAAVQRRLFDPNDAQPRPAAFENIDAVIHLAGESVAGRWTPAKKQAIRDSRIKGTQHLVASLAACARRPQALISSSAVGFYGSRGDEPLFESSQPGTDFLAQVCVAWESAALTAQWHGIRTALLRTGIVLGNEAGALKAMAAPFRFGAGGPLGTGRQFVPWIHIEDLVALFLFALDNELEGPLNAVAPDYATSARFSQALGQALRRPALAPAPAFALRAILGEFASSILASQLVVPARAEDAGFQWRYTLIEAAMAQATHSQLAPPYGVYRFESSQTVTASMDEIFAFFCDPHNLEYLTPPSLRFAFASCPQIIERGSRISYRLRLHGFPLRWETLIARWQPPRRFVDVQLHGPYALWRHEHIFEQAADGVKLIDRVDYVLPFAPLGKLARSFVKQDVDRIFSYRRTAIQEHFSR